MTSLRGMDRWVGKTAVVTGAGGGVGAGVAATLAGVGMRVVALDCKEEAAITETLNQLKFTDTVTARQCDVADLAQLGATFRWLDQNHGGVHVLVNLAGVQVPAQIPANFAFDTSGEEASEAQGPAVDINPVMLCARHALVCMRKHGIDGHIINVNRNCIPACTQTLKQELACFKSKIKVTSISPGKVNSKTAPSMSDDLVEELNTCPALKPRDIANAVVYALSTPPDVNVHELAIAPVTDTTD